MLPEVESLRLEFRVLWLPTKALPSSEEPDISSSIVNSKAAFILVPNVRIVSPKHGSVLTTCSNDLYVGILNG